MKSIKAKQIFSGNTNNNGLIVTENFNKANLLFIKANDLPVNEGYEIASALMVKIITKENIGGLEVTTDYGEKEISLNLDFIDTENIVIIPSEISNSEFNCYLVLATSYSINVTVYAVTITDTTIEQIYTEIQQIKNILGEVKEKEVIQDLLNVGIQFISTAGNILLPAEALLLLPALI